MLPEAITPEIVVEHHGEPMTTSLAIAEGVQLQHKNVLALVRKYIEDIDSFGRVAFETRPFDTAGGRQWVDIAWLNEQQATFLLTLMRNSPIVIEFKKALVRAFFALREQVRAAHAAPGPFLTGNPAHAADQLVSADRIFRSLLRAGRSAGVALPVALRRANQVARERTGIDLFSELDLPEPDGHDCADVVDPFGAHAFCDAWLGGELPVPAIPCRSEDLYRAYLHWCAQSGCEHGTLPRVVATLRRRPDLRHRRARYMAPGGCVLMSGFILPQHESFPPPGVPQSEWLTHRARQFEESFLAWRTPPDATS
ncbi:MAG TPA: Rha family transcriptional regulator [Xanthomonadaceae bacterium]|nr:Rha family transcriptional regulator [Xanthomonadaceae bacterium]